MGSIYKIKETFIFEKYGHINPEFDGVYSPKINSFVEFLIDRKNLMSNPKGVNGLLEIDDKDILESMRFYIIESRKNSSKKYWVERVNTLKRRVTVVREFFKYLQKEGHVNESIMIEIARWDDDKNYRDKFIKGISEEFKLIDNKEKPPYEDDELQCILDGCFKITQEIDEKEMFRKKKHTDYTQFVSALIIMLICETGIKYKVIGSIRREDVDFDNSIISIGRYSIPISKKLNEGLIKYVRIRDGIAQNEPKLFVKSERSNSPYVNSYVSSVMRRLTSEICSEEQTNTTGLAKNKIINLLTVGVPEIYIKEWTTFTDVVIEDCKRYVKTEVGQEYDHINKYIHKAFNRQDDGHLV